MDVVNEFQKYFEGNSKKMSELFSNFTEKNPVGDWVSTYYKDMFAQTNEIFTNFMKQDVFSKVFKEIESYQKEFVTKISDLTKDSDEFKKVQKQIEDFMVGSSKKYLDMANTTIKESYEKLNKTITENLGKIDFAKFFNPGIETEKKVAQTKKA